MMTFDSAIAFDKSFIADRITEMTKLIEFRLNNDDFTAKDYSFCMRCLDSLHGWVQRVYASDEFSEPEFIAINSKYRGFVTTLWHWSCRNQCSLSKAQSEETQQVFKPVPPAQLPVFRLLGSVNSSCSVSEKSPGIKPLATARIAGLSAYWTPSSTITKQLLSNTRPVGGLA